MDACMHAWMDGQTHSIHRHTQAHIDIYRYTETYTVHRHKHIQAHTQTHRHTDTNTHTTS